MIFVGAAAGASGFIAAKAPVIVCLGFGIVGAIGIGILARIVLPEWVDSTHPPSYAGWMLGVLAPITLIVALLIRAVG